MNYVDIGSGKARLRGFYFVSLVPNECNEISSFSPELQFVVDFLASKE
jgi:hypothetical protein